jgi:hypothetical protein
VTGRSIGCVKLILKHNPDTSKTTSGEDQTALHTAVRMGAPEISSLLMEHSPCLTLQKNVHGQTPLELAEEILKDLSKFQAFMATQRRRPIGSKKEFEALLAMLRDVPPV